MRKHLRLWLPGIVLAALVSAGCLLISGQFVVTYVFKDHGYDPLTMTSALSVTGVQVNLNTIPEYLAHKKDLKDILDISLLGDLTNLDGSQPVTAEVWMVPHHTDPLYTTDAQVRAAGSRIWGPITVAAGGTKHIGWNESAQLSVGKAQVMYEVKHGGQFDLYALGNGGYHFQLTNGAFVAVIAAGR
jgi:hypothetical protein